jgi:hypothetical protein
MKKILTTFLIGLSSLFCFSQPQIVKEISSGNVSFSLVSSIIITDTTPLSLNPIVPTECDSFLWTTSGTGTFIDNHLKKTIYTPSEDDLLLDTITLSLKSWCDWGDSAILYSSRLIIVESSDNEFITQWLLPAGSFTLPAGDIGTYNAEIDFGDNSGWKTITSYNDADLTHTYSSSKVYQIRIRGTFPWFCINNGSVKAYLQKVTQWGKVNSLSFENSFYGCSHLVELPNGAINDTRIVTFRYCFVNCTRLAAIPVGLFDNNKSATSFYAVFYNCASLASVPVGLFKYNILATSFKNSFYSCSKLQLNSEIFCNTGEESTRFFNQSIDFTTCFSRASFTGIQGIAPDLWNYDFGSGTPTSTSCFRGDGNSLTSISNYGDIPVGYK